MIKLAPAPHRTLRTWSVIALGVVALGDITLAFVHTLFDLTSLSAPIIAAGNALASLVIVVLRFSAQTIAVTREEKVDLLTATANAPMLPVERDVAVHVDGDKVN